MCLVAESVASLTGAAAGTECGCGSTRATGRGRTLFAFAPCGAAKRP
jgi:hypothetical protein